KEEDKGGGMLTPVAYLWTRTVVCKNPTCKATVPLVRQTWLCRKKGRYAALKIEVPRDGKRVRFEVVEAPSERELSFDPANLSKAGNASCPFCGTVADSRHVRDEGKAGRLGRQLMAVVGTRQGARGKVYLAAEGVPGSLTDDETVHRRLAALCE